jgi:hypothetical protein
MSDKMIDHLKLLASSDAFDDDCNDDTEQMVIYDIFGSNVDDAYEGGKDDGQISLARDILSDMGIKWWS